MLGSVPPAKAGLGASIIEAVARQLHAEITVTDNQPGAKVTLTHTRPDPRLAAATPAELAV